MPFVVDSDRFGVNVILNYGKNVDDYNVGKLNAGWYLDYATYLNPSTPGGMAFVHVLRVPDLQRDQWKERVEALVRANLGALWLIGNEPDRDIQDGITAEEYAKLYHEVYTLIKELDPLAIVGIGAIIQSTPVRLRYLNRFVAHYQRLYRQNPPIDYWNIHGFILREDPRDWGAGIPPGLEAYAAEGILYEVWDHGDFEEFKRLLIEFRTWMADNGYQGVPLTVSEYGILMPPDYFAVDGGAVRYDNAFVSNYMRASFDFFMETKDPQIGYELDDFRLVQSWAWYSLNDYIYDSTLPPEVAKGSNGSLFDHDSGAFLPLGQDFAGYTGQFYKPYSDNAVRQIAITSGPNVPDPQHPGTITVTVHIHNRGNQPAPQTTVRLWLGNPNQGGQLIGQQVLGTVDARCAEQQVLTFTWKPAALRPGASVLFAQVVTGSSPVDGYAFNNLATTTLIAGDPAQLAYRYLPSLSR
jgi:hypothetical protein